jgi:type VI secretion system secreted protein Hcp
MPIFLKLDMIKGESRALGHAGEIDVASLTYGVTRPIAMTIDGIRAEPPSVSEITMSKMNDSASLPLIRAAMADPRVGTARITFADMRADELVNYFVIEMQDARVSSMATSSDGDRPLEQVTLTAPRMRWIYQPPGVTPTSFGYDFVYDKTF